MPLIERVLDRTLCSDLPSYQDRGGGRGLGVARQFGPAAVIEEIEASGLRGRGGAGFPTGTKWRTLAAADDGRSLTLVVNAAEGEPSTFKDRELLRMNPYKVIEGALVAAFAVGATEVVVALKASFEREVARVREAIAAVTDAGWVDGVDLRVHEGPSSYLFGEETGLLEVLEGRQPFPRVSPPYRGGGEPVLANNVETLANVPAILAEGATWFREVGTDGSPGTAICTMCGHCRNHAVGEVTMGTTLREAIELIGGGAEGSHVVAAMSGVANAIVPEALLDTELTYEAMASIGSGLGAAGYFVIDDRTDVVAVAAGAARFLAVESCGQCEPCKRDGLAIADDLGAMRAGTAPDATLDDLKSRLTTVADGARCFLAQQQERVIGSALRLFPDRFEARVGEDRVEDPGEEDILPIVDIVDGRAVLDEAQRSKQPDWTHDEPWSGAWPAASRPADAVDVDIDLRSARESQDDPSEALATAPPTDVDPLQTLTDLQRELSRTLGCVLATRPADRKPAVESLRDQLLVYDDVMRRVVHPWVARVAGAAGDDATWDAEHEARQAEHLLRAIHEAHANPDDAALGTLTDLLRDTLDRREPATIQLLRAHLDDDDLRDIGDAVDEARAEAESSVLTA